MDLYRITTRYASGGIEVSNGVVVKAAPIFRHFEGRLFENVITWAKSVGAELEKIPPAEDQQ